MKKKILKISFSLMTALTLTLSSVLAQTSVEKKFVENIKKPTTAFQDETVVRVIVQTNQSAKIDGGKNSYQQLIDKIHAITGEIVIKQQFDYLVSGFSFDVKRKYIPAIATLKEVKSIKEARKFHPTMVDAVTMTQAQSVWTSKSYKGEGMVVSVIDTGIDVEHKDMRLDNPENAKIKTITAGKETKFNIKVPYGYNYADGNDNVKDSDLNQKSMHGMHVAGIVAANATDEEVSKKLGIDGVAPEAQLLAMKVFTNSGEINTAFEDAIVKAIEDSVKYGADVINMSLGTDNGFHDDEAPESIAIKRAREQGVIVIVSAGNAGMSTTKDENQRIPTNDLDLRDNAAVGEPSTASAAISVASANNATETGYFGRLDGEQFLFKTATHPELWNTTQAYPIVDVGVGGEDDYRKDGSEIDLTNKVAFITRGGDIMFSEKYERAIAHHAAGVIVANNVEGEFGMAGVGNFTLPGVTVDKATGEQIKAILRADSKVQIKFDEKSYIGSNEVSSFTSWGPAHDLSFKPEIMAPGGNIYSTFNNNAYGLNSGTSMAAPHISGAVALMKGALKNTDVNFDYFVKKSLMNTAKPLLDVAQGTNLEVSPRRQGAGLAQIENAINNRVVVVDENGESAKALKEIENSTTFTLTLENLGDKVETYNIRFGSVLTEETDSTNKRVKDVVMPNASISADKTTITIQPKSKTTLTVTLDTTNAPKEQFAEGYIYFDSTTNAPSLTYAYMGYNGDWGKEKVFDEVKDGGGVYDTLGLADGGSYLGSSYDIFTMREKIDPERVAISPNNDEHFDSFTTILGLLRNVEKLEVDVVTEASDTAEPFVSLTTRKNVRKPLFKTKDAVNFYTGNWDGKVFNQETGEYEIAPDGQYYVRLKATLPSTKTRYQYKYLPFKVDTTKPKITIVSQAVEGDEYVIKFTATDDGIGVDEEGTGAYINNEDKETLYSDFDGTFEYRIPKADIDSGKVKSATIGTLDSVYNVATETIVFNENAVLFHNAVELVGKRSKYLTDDNYNLLGRVGESVTQLIINGQEIPLEEKYFDTTLALVEGMNEINYVAKNATGDIVNQGAIQMRKDTTPPQLSITNLDPTQLQKLPTNALEVAGRVVDENNQPVKVRIGHTSVEVTPEGTFSGSTKVDWTKIVNVRAVDEAGNETVIPIRTVFEEEGEFKIYFGASLGLVNFYNAETPYIVDGKLKVTGHMNQKVKALYIGGELVPVNEENRFDVLVPVKEVDNHISVKVVGMNGDVIYEEGRAVYYDKTMPNLQVTAGAVIEDDKIYTNDEALVVRGEISDNGQGYRMYLNGSETALYEQPVSLGNDVTKQTFEKSFTVKDGDVIFFEVSDSIGNKFDKRYTVVLDKTTPVIEVEEKTLFEGDTVAVTTEENAKLRVSVDGQPYENGNPLNVGTHTLIAEATDKAGNVGRVEKTIVVNERFTLNNVSISSVVGEQPDLSKLSVLDNKENAAKTIQSVQLVDKLPATAGKHTVNVKVVLDNGVEVIKPIMLHVLPIKTTHQTGNVTVSNGEYNAVLTMKVDALPKERFNALKNKDVDVYDIYFVDGENNRAQNVKGDFVVSVKKQNKPVKAVYYVDQDGQLVSHAFTDGKDTVTFKTSHFSVYAVEYQSAITQKSTSKNDVDTSDINGLVYLSLVLSAVGLYVLKRKQ